jgi:predicted metal-dependent HD superfamily phosphohydrolase
VTVHSSVAADLEGVELPLWKRDLILSLAAAMDESPSASTAKELRLLMEDVVAVSVESGDRSDDLAAKRAARRSAAS